MKNIFNSQLKKDVEKLKEEVFGREKENKDELVSSWSSTWYSPMWSYLSRTLKDRVESLEKEKSELRSDFNKLLKHLNLECYKITEENGEKKITEGYRTIKKKKVVKEKRQCSSCDED